MLLRLLGFTSVLFLLLASAGFAQQPARDLFDAVDRPTAGPSKP